MKRVFIASATLLAPYAFAADFYCQGTAWAFNGQQVDHSLVLKLNSETGEVQVDTFSGWAIGTLDKGPKLYVGSVRAGESDYFVNLDRFTGEFSLIRVDKSNAPLRAEFNGSCERREPKI